MSWQIIKQPNGKYALWSSVVDNFVMYDATEQDIIDEFVDRERERVQRNVQEILDKIKAGEKAYYQFTMSFDEAIETIRERHGDKECEEILYRVER